ncbi:MAG: inorganic phosphate transporter PiT family [Halothiobacillaceae bacterium]|nr:MAG: inorganic phosphate transporter PiT family [Halothiobacillaceae bacterium]
MEYLLILSALFLVFSNGANDNFKGFATVWGSHTLSYRTALRLATMATLAGSLCSLLLAETLAQQFSGRGLVPDATANAPQFLLSVSIGAALTVFAATRLGLPISTTHALLGGLVGAGLGMGSGELHLDKLSNTFLLPLLLSPLLAATLSWLIYRSMTIFPAPAECACLTATAPAVPTESTAMALLSEHSPSLVIATTAECAALPAPTTRLALSRLGDYLHIFSAALICFARAVNDTPKLAALLIGTQLLDNTLSFVAIALIMASGGLLFARRVAHTMSHRVTRLNNRQGLTANLITATLVLLASKLGLPVSTTHVSVSSIAGVGAGAHTLHWSMVRNIALSWLATLPLAATFAWGAQWVMK